MLRMKTRKVALLSAALAAMFLLAACGKSDAGINAAPASAPATDGPRTIAITADDTMKFSVTEIHAKPGETFRVSLKNAGRVPKQAMAHNWVLLKSMADSDVNALAMAAATKAPEFMPADLSAVLAHTKVLGPGESDTIEVTAPSAPGEYPFLCTFPGHFAMMKGKLIVQ